MDKKANLGAIYDDSLPKEYRVLSFCILMSPNGKVQAKFSELYNTTEGPKELVITELLRELTKGLVLRKWFGEYWGDLNG